MGCGLRSDVLGRAGERVEVLRVSFVGVDGRTDFGLLQVERSPGGADLDDNQDPIERVTEPFCEVREPPEPGKCVIKIVPVGVDG